MKTALCDGGSRRVALLSLLGAALFVCAGCAGAADPTIAEGVDGTYVGAIRVDGNDVAVGLVVRDRHASFYACGEGPTLATHTRWLAGPLDGGTVHLEIEGMRVDGALSGDAAGGVLTREGDAPLSWSAVRVPDDGIAGLYSATDEGCKTGVVVWSDADGEPALQGSWCNEAGARMQVQPILPVERVVDSIEVSVPLTPPRRLVVRAVDLAGR